MRRLILPLLLLLTARGVVAQDLGETLSEVGSAYAQAYVRPLADAIGTDLNSGLVHAARWKGGAFDLNVYLGVKVFGTFVPEDERTFDLTYASQITIEDRVGLENVRISVPAQVTVQGAPTVFGDSQPAIATVHARYDTTVSQYGVLLPVQIDTTYTIETVGGVLETGIAPLLVPQMMIGTFYGTDLMVRWLPQISAQDVGSVEILGFGIRHSIDQYVPDLPVGIAVQLSWQKMAVDDAEANQVVDATFRAANLAVNKRFGPLFLYGGLQVEESSMDVSYILRPTDAGEGVEVDEVPVEFSLRGAARQRGLLGFAFHAKPLHLTGDVSFSDYGTTLTAGIGIAF